MAIRILITIGERLLNIQRSSFKTKSANLILKSHKDELSKNISERNFMHVLITYLYRVWGIFFAHVSEHPIIVIGDQKSGTSVIAHLLADFGGLSKTIDIPPLWGWAGADIMRGKVKFASVVEQHKHHFSTELIKEPNMTFFIDQVIEFFPNAQYVFVIRDPRDNIRSQLNRRKLPGNLEHLEPQHLAGLSPKRVLVSEKIWGVPGENYIGMLACRWNRAIDQYVHFQDRMILAKYEEFMRDKYNFIQGIALQLKLSQKVDISDRLDVQYQPRGNREISWKEFFERANLQRIERICESKMRKFGYVCSLTESSTE